MTNTDVSIILVSYNTEQLTKNCLTSVFENTKNINFDVYVVDNSSRDNTCEMIEKDFPQVKLIKSQKNLGFGCANNIAVSHSQAKYLFFLNTDTILIDNPIKTLFDMMENDALIGACGGNLYDSDNRHVHSFGHFQTFKRKAVQVLKLGLFFPNEKLLNKDKGHNEENQFKEVDLIIGADLFVRKSVIDKVGSFDKDFFMYDEESELQYRIKKAGYKIVINPDARIYHLEGKSTKNRLFARSNKMKSEILFYIKAYGRKHLLLYKLLCIVPNLLRLVSHPVVMGKTICDIIRM